MMTHTEHVSGSRCLLVFLTGGDLTVLLKEGLEINLDKLIGGRDG
jgi:hypothetical protein